jgi:oligopeptide transport system ATP-binding protein
VINLLKDLQKDMGLSLIFIAHDLSIVKHISHKVMVLYLGKTMEIAKSEDIYNNPLHPYTQSLISAVPIPDPVIEKNKKLLLLEGELPSPINPPSGCVFRTRCPKADSLCSNSKPELSTVKDSHLVACHYRV